MTSATLLRPVDARDHLARDLWCAACFEPVGQSDTGLYCAACSCGRCGEDATGFTTHDGFCAHCAEVLQAEGFLG